MAAEANRQHLLSKSSPYRGDKYSIEANKHRRQRDKLDKALVKRFQDEKEELTQSKARIRELEDAIRKFLEADMKMDDKLSYGEVVPTKLSQAVKEARRGLLDIMPLSDKEK